MMELLTITCHRDIHDMVLQAHSIQKFVLGQAKHTVVVEDGSLSEEEWLNVLSPYYTNHNLNLIWLERGDVSFPGEFISINGSKKFGIGGPGWRRQQILKLKITSEITTSDTVLVLDSKNIFVSHIDLNSWPVKHGNGNYIDTKTLLNEIEPSPGVKTIQQWLLHLENERGLKIPEKISMILETPFRWNVNLIKSICDNYDIDELFLNPDIIPHEFHLYFFFVNPDELEPAKDVVCRVLFGSPPEQHFHYYITNDIKKCDEISSPTHGLHRQTRMDIPDNVSEIYKKWLTNKGLDDKLVCNYMQWCKD
jgi:hypothetical protein